MFSSGSRGWRHGNDLAMYSCSETRKLLHPSLDRELDIQESLHVQTHLKDCAVCREQLLDEQEFLTSLPSLLAPPPAPDTVRQAVSDALTREAHRIDHGRRGWRALLSPGMFAAVAALTLFLFAIPRSQTPALVRIALAEHRLYMKDPARLDIAGRDVPTVTRSIEQRLPFPVHIPPQTADNVHLMGADVTPHPIPAAVLAYQVDGSLVSLLVTTHREISMSNAETRTFKKTLFRSASLEGLHILQWSDHRHTYVLVACREIPVDSLPFSALIADSS